MRSPIPATAERYRVTVGPWATAAGAPAGLFLLPVSDGTLEVVVGGDEHAEGWEHVRVNHPRRWPMLEECRRIRELFWAPEDTVITLITPAAFAERRNCLHLLHHPDPVRPLIPRHLLRPAPCQGPSGPEPVAGILPRVFREVAA